MYTGVIFGYLSLPDKYERLGQTPKHFRLEPRPHLRDAVEILARYSMSEN